MLAPDPIHNARGSVCYSRLLKGFYAAPSVKAIHQNKRFEFTPSFINLLSCTAVIPKLSALHTKLLKDL